jgi:hypothetical protein
MKRLLAMLVLCACGGCLEAEAVSLAFFQNAAADHDYGRQSVIPAGFGSGEFTLELWIKPDHTLPVGPTTDGTPAQLFNWTACDNAPYSTGDWWYEGNFLLDGHNNGVFADGTFSLQFYGGGRLRWLRRFSRPGRHLVRGRVSRHEHAVPARRPVASHHHRTPLDQCHAVAARTVD